MSKPPSFFRRVVSVFFLCVPFMWVQAGAPEIIPFKTVGPGDELTLHVFFPPGHDKEKPVPGIVLFFGGGWRQGAPGAMYAQAQYLASRGMVAISAQYRTKASHDVYPNICVIDGRSAIRYVREHAAELGIDPEKLLAGGGSAGGHVAACTALENAPNDPADDLSVSPKPAALVLFNPVLDVGPEGYAHGYVKNNTPDWTRIDPRTLAGEEFPPTLIMVGTEDKILPEAMIYSFQEKLEASGAICVAKLYEGAGHGFFNRPPYLDATRYQADLFLQKLGFLKGESPLKPEVYPVEDE